MVTFKNNNRRNNYKRNDRNFKNNGSDRNKFNSSFSNNENFIEKYNNLAREASSSGDKILSESYFQHADHFTRILKEQENLKKNRFQKDTTNNNFIKENSNIDKSEIKEKKENFLKGEKNQPEFN